MLTIPLCMMTWSNTFVYSCECVCLLNFFFCFYFNPFFSPFFFLSSFFVVWCLLTFHIQMELMQRLDRWNEYVCMYVCMPCLSSIRHHTMKYGGVEVQLLTFLSLSLDGQWLASHSHYPLEKRLGGPQRWAKCGGKEKTLHHAWNYITHIW